MDKDKGILKKHLEKKEDKYSLGSREKLKASMRHKITRTFCSCLDAAEKELMTTSKGREMFKRIRSRVLSTGNDQIRNMEVELEKYNVEFIPYHVEFRIVDTTKEENQEE